jgi:hypothetical protein
LRAYENSSGSRCSRAYSQLAAASSHTLVCGLSVVAERRREREREWVCVVPEAAGRGARGRARTRDARRRWGRRRRAGRGPAQTRACSPLPIWPRSPPAPVRASQFHTCTQTYVKNRYFRH